MQKSANLAPLIYQLRLNYGSEVRLRPMFPKHVWSYDFMQSRSHYGVLFKIPNISDQYSRESLAVRMVRRLTNQDVYDVLAEQFIQRGVLVQIRSDRRSEFTAKRIRNWLARLKVKPLFIEPGSPWENGYIEPFNGRMRDELLNGESFTTVGEAQVLIEMRRKEYNTIRPHSLLDYQPLFPTAMWYNFHKFNTLDELCECAKFLGHVTHPGIYGGKSRNF